MKNFPHWKTYWNATYRLQSENRCENSTMQHWITLKVFFFKFDAYYLNHSTFPFHIENTDPGLFLARRDMIPNVFHFMMHKSSRRVRWICDVVGELVGCALSLVLAFLIRFTALCQLTGSVVALSATISPKISDRSEELDRSSAGLLLCVATPVCNCVTCFGCQSLQHTNTIFIFI